jgi:hypothetical protein
MILIKAEKVKITMAADSSTLKQRKGMSRYGEKIFGND